MANNNTFNVYEALGLDRSLSNSQFLAEIDDRIAATEPADNQTLDMLRTSRSLFTEDARRNAYDEALDAPSGREISISEFRDFAAGSHPAIRHESDSQLTQSFATPLASMPASTPSAPAYSSAAPQTNYNASSTAWTAPSKTEQGSTMTIDLSKFGVSPARKRSESLMWAIGCGIIGLAWIFMLLRSLILLNQASASFLGAVSAFENLSETVITVLVMSISILVIWQCLWVIRKWAGRNIR
ncbi:MAG: hypothetical protein SOW59_03670 [Corynebacterium sp.]|nr:hypothetical protein [Corynebacterium sp.]